MEGTLGIIEGAFKVFGPNKMYPKLSIVSTHSNMDPVSRQNLQNCPSLYRFMPSTTSSTIKFYLQCLLYYRVCRSKRILVFTRVKGMLLTANLLVVSAHFENGWGFLFTFLFNFTVNSNPIILRTNRNSNLTRNMAH